MNESKMSIYHKIHRLHRLGFNKSQIERKTGVNRDTVRKYLNMDFDEMVHWTHSLQNRKKKLDDYETIIVEWLKEHSDLSASQVEDWLLEEYPGIEVGSNEVILAVRNEELLILNDISGEEITRHALSLEKGK